jgi:hypothetical protein
MSFIDDAGFEPVNDVVEEEELPELTDYGRRFLENSPEEHRPILEPVIRKWDDGHKKQVARYEEQLNQYRQLGPVEELAPARQLYNILINDPQRMVDYLVNERGFTPSQAAKAVGEAQDNAVAQQQPGVPKEYEERLRRAEQAALAAVQQQRQFFEQQQAAREQQEYVAQLQAAKNKFGDFDERYVSYLLATEQATTVEEAVKFYHRTVRPPQRRGATPPLLGANAAAPTSGGKKANWGEASDNEIKDFLVHSLRGE